MSAIFESAEGAVVQIDGVHYDWFRGNGYLGLYDHPQLLQAACQATRSYGMKTRNKDSGRHPCLHALQQAACAYFACEAVLPLPSGFCGPAVLLEAFGGSYEHVFIDQHAHLSLSSAVRGAGVPVHVFAHRDASDLAAQLQQLRPAERPLVLTDALFPISGALAPLEAYRRVLADWPGSILLADDAHGAGVLGRHGRGTLEHVGLRLGPGPVYCQHTVSLSKAFGCHGGLLCGSHAEIARFADTAVARGASLPPPGVLAAAATALQLARAHPGWRHTLAGHIRRVRSGLRQLGFALDEHSPSPIIYLPGAHLAGLADTLMQVERIAVLYQQGGYPGVPLEGALLFTLFASHSEEQVTRLLQAFRRHA